MDSWKKGRADLKKALIPISLNTDRFSSKNVVDLLKSFDGYYDELELLIADRIQIFNRVAMAVQNGDSLIDLSRIENSVSQTGEERRRWASRILSGIKNRKSEIRISFINEYLDLKYSDILRRVHILYEIDKMFRSDVNCDIGNFLETKQDLDSPILNVWENMSKLYILEEAALSVRVHCYGGINTEIYMGKPINSIQNLYKNQYILSLNQVSGLNNTEEYEFKFLEDGGII